MALTTVSTDRLRKLLTYDPLSGEFTRNVSIGGKFSGTTAGTITSQGYVGIRIGKIRYYAHRLAWLWMTGQWPTKDIDHKNGARSDNKWNNLRLASPSENQANAKRPSHNKSGYKGVHFYPRYGKWRAVIMVDKKSLSIGYFQTIEEAHKAYCEAARTHFGEYARLQ